MPLSAEDSLRLNVMLATKPHAIRIDESRMQVWCLGIKGDSRIDLSPNCRDERYLKQVKELLSGHVLGSPGGYPVYISRWTRMGQMRDDSLEHLLLLGEREAVIAAVHANGLTDEMAYRAWWIMEDAENARQMLRKSCIVQGRMGTVLARWLIEFLPFETEAEDLMETIKLVLQGDLVDEDGRAELWKKAKRKPAYYIGFLATSPDRLPMTATAHPKFEAYSKELLVLVESGNELSALLYRVLSAKGQAWVKTLSAAVHKPNNQDVVNQILDVTAAYFKEARAGDIPDYTFEELRNEANLWQQSDTKHLTQLREVCPLLLNELRAMRVLSGLSYAVVRPVFRDSTAIGSLMRKKIAPVFEMLETEIKALGS